MLGSVVILGFRLGWPRDRNSFVRLSLVALGVAICTAVACAAVAAPQVVSGQRERVADLALSPGDRGSSLLADDLADSAERRWGGFDVARVLVAIPGDDEQDVMPLAGTSTIPGPGEALVSPRLNELMRTDDTIKALMSSYDIAGTVDDSGLVSPRELRAVIGVSPETTGLEPSDGQGVAVSPLSFSERSLQLGLGLLLLIVVSIPTVALVVLSARLGSRERRSRIRSLRQLGTSRLMTRAVMATETAVAAIPGAGIGLVVFSLARDLNHVPGTRIDFDGSAANLGAQHLVLVVVLVAIAAMVIAAGGIGIDESDGSAASQRGRRGSTTSVVGFLALGCAGLSLFALPWLPEGAVKAMTLWVLLGVAALGLLLCAAGIVVGVSRIAARFSRTAGGFVGFRINTVEPGTTTRLAGVVAVVLVGIAGAGGFLAILQGGSDSRASQSADNVTVSVSDYASALNVKRVKAVEGVSEVLPVIDLRGDKDTVLAVVADCDELARFASVSAVNCSNSPQWVGSQPNGRAIVLSSSTRLDVGGRRIPVPPLRDAVNLAGIGSIFEGLAKVPSGAVTANVQSPRRYLVRVPSGQVPQTLAALSSLAPTAGFDFGDASAADDDSSEYAVEVAVLMTGSAIAVVVAALALAVSASGETRARRDRLAGLAVLGASRRERTRTHVATTLMPLMTLAAASLAVAWAVNSAMHLLDDRAGIGVSSYALMFGGCLAAAAMITVATLPSALRPEDQG